MCWPLTRRGGHTATTKETERPPPPGGPVGAMRRNARERRRGLLAARGHDRRSPPVESQGDGRMRTGTGPETTSWPSLITSQAWQCSFTGRGEKVLFR